ncbi:RHS repeat protein [Nonomuraea deserti]|uniref:RHS repeat protein n=1 Tax=Nonomuraea deserti TaxID=1848322 RepID=A0A4R4VUD3_9ACTN|nr:RHS repeat protein [Nonomuraea deserti]
MRRATRSSWSPAARRSRRPSTTTFEYDRLGRQVRVTDPAPMGQQGGTWVTEYDMAGEKLAVVDPTGARTGATYDDLGRQITATQIERKPSTASYTTTMEYDDAGRLVKQVAPGGKVTSYGVNAAGEVTSVTGPLNNTTSMDYGREAAVAYGVEWRDFRRWKSGGSAPTAGFQRDGTPYSVGVRNAANEYWAYVSRLSGASAPDNNPWHREVRQCRR